MKVITNEVMKKYIFIVLLVGVCFGQDILVLKTNQKIKGQYLGLNLFDVSFMPEKTKFPQDVPVTRVKNVILSDGSLIQMHIPPKRPSGEISAEKLSKMTKKWLNEQEKLKCDENSEKSIVVLPLKDDLYGITEDIAKTLQEECYNNKSNLQLLKSIVQEKIDLNNINDYQLKELANDNGISLIVFGYLYTLDIPFMYTADPSNLSAYDLSLIHI